MTEVLVFGLTGQVGEALLPLLLESKCRVTAVSRTKKTSDQNIVWQQAGFSNFNSLEKKYDIIISLGPLDAFSAWLSCAGIEADKIITLSSTSIVTKRNSPDINERKLSQVLFESEQLLLEHANQTTASLIILRPTLMYGLGRDKSLSRCLALARRYKVLVLPMRANGLRQPVHVADVADAVFKAMFIASTNALTLNLPGGETLAFDQMLLRSLKVHAPGAKVLRVPNFLFQWLLQIAVFLGLASGLGAGFFARLRQDWVFDVTPARKELAYRPRPFSQ